MGVWACGCVGMGGRVCVGVVMWVCVYVEVCERVCGCGYGCVDI